MPVDRIWAPWRINYITAITEKPKGCVFCRILKEKKDAANLIFIRDKHSFAVLNIYPYNNGHALIIPYRHVKDLRDLRREERENLFDVMASAQALIDKAIRPNGYNIGVNIGKVAGAGFPGHVHIHIVPRWKGDVNFMPVTADTKVVSQSLKDLYRRLVAPRKKRTKG